MDIPNPSHWRRILPYWTDGAREAWGRLAAKYDLTGLSWQESEWRAFLCIKVDLTKWEDHNPDIVDKAYAKVTYIEQQDEPTLPHGFDSHVFHIPSHEWLDDYFRECVAHAAALPFPKDVAAEIEATRKKLESTPKMRLERKQASSPKPRKEPKPKAEPKCSRHDPSVGSLFT